VRLGVTRSEHKSGTHAREGIGGWRGLVTWSVEAELPDGSLAQTESAAMP